MQRQQKKLQKVKQILKKRKINMQIEEINIEGKKIGTHEVSDKIFSLKPRKDLIQLVINWQMNEQMKKKGHTKSRGEVKGSRRKIVQQKDRVVQDMVILQLQSLLAVVLLMVQDTEAKLLTQN